MKRKKHWVRTIGWLWLLSVALPVFAQADIGRRRELDEWTRELRDTIRTLENQKNRLGFSATDLQHRHQISELLSAKRAELGAVESLRSRLTGSSDPQRSGWQETRLREAQLRSLRAEIRLLETRKNLLDGCSGVELQQRSALGELISRKRAVLNAAESSRLGVGSETRMAQSRDRELLDAEIRVLAEEIRWLEKERSRLAYSSAELQQRTELAALIASKRALLAAKEHRRLRSR